MVRLVCRVVGYAALFGPIGAGIAFRAANPALTETQAFLAMWPLELLSFVGVVILAYGETREV